MPALTYPSSTNFHVVPLPPDAAKESLVGVEIAFNDSSRKTIVSFDDLTLSDLDLFRYALFTFSAIVIRNQQGIDPNTLPALATIWDETAQKTHSGGPTALKSSKNILSQNLAERIPRANQVTILGEGQFDGYEGFPSLKLHHVVRVLSDYDGNVRLCIHRALS